MKFGHLLRISLQLFRSRLFGNLIVVLELVSVCVLTVLISNVINISEKSVRIIENSPYRSLYYKIPFSLTVDFSNSDEIIDDDSWYETSYIDKLDSYISENDFVRGYQDFVLSETALSPDFMSGARVQLLNEIGIEALDFEVSDGIWLSKADLDAEYIPVVIGGKTAGNYYVGQKLTTYYIVNETADTSGLPENEGGMPYKEYKLQVVGKLAYPELSLFSNTTVIGDTRPIGYYFTDRSVDDLFMFIPYDRYSDAMFVRERECFIFYDRDATDEQVSELQTVIGNGYSYKTEQMIADQRADTDENLSASMPFVVLAAIIVLVGVLFTCTLTAVSNMGKFRIYFLCGMSRRESLYVIFIFTVIFSLCSAAVFGLTMIIIGGCGLEPSGAAYLTPRLQSVISVMLLITAVMVVSFMLPAIIMSKTNVIDLIRNYGKE